MRKWSIAVLAAAILIAAVFLFIHRRHDARPSITGIGIMLTVRDHQLEVMGVLPGSPAAKAGMHRGLIIQQIDGIDVTGRPLVECVAMTRGPVGSTVRLEIVDRTKSETNLVKLTRVKLSLPVERGTMKPMPARP